MTTNRITDSYIVVANAYVDGVRALFAPPGAPTGARGGRGPVSPADLASQAECLIPLSADLTRAAADRLTDPSVAVPVEASTQLLAKALTDLDVGTYLLQVAEDEAAQVAWASGTSTKRSRSRIGAMEEQLQLILGAGEGGQPPLRGATAPKDLPAARADLTNAIEDTLALITERAGSTGQLAFSGLLGLGATELAQAAGAVGLGIAEALGQAEKVTPLYALVRDFAINAYNALLALLGPQLAPVATKQVTTWLGEIKQGRLFGPWLKRLYEPEQTNQELRRFVTDSTADLEQFVSAIQRISALDAAHQKQSKLIDKIVKGLNFLGGVPAAALPQARLLLAAALIVVGAYVVLSGADYADARRLQRLDRVPGVRHVVEASLQRGEEVR